MHNHQFTVAEILDTLGSSENGLTTTEANRRIKLNGFNELQEQKPKSLVTLIVEQFSDFMIIVLLASAFISGLVGDLVDTIAIVVIVILNAGISIYQMIRADRAVTALRKHSAQSANVLRNGVREQIPARHLVVGDVVIVDAGCIVPADARLIECFGLTVDEAALTGEFIPSVKTTHSITQSLLPIGDRTNMVFKGTAVSNGRATAVVVETGMNTELGRIAGLLARQHNTKTPLQKRIADFGKKLSIAILSLCAILFFFGIVKGVDPVHMLLTSISLAVAAIPEALPAVVAIALALSAKKMVSKNVLIRDLPAVETLGSVTVICSDKTGTITQQRMTVAETWAPQQKETTRNSIDQSHSESDELQEELDRAIALCNDVVAEGEVLHGDHTEVALFRYAEKKILNREALFLSLPRVAEIPFDSERKRMTTIHRAVESSNQLIAMTKGAPESVVAKCSHTSQSNSEKQEHGSLLRALEVAEEMAQRGLRVLAVATKTLSPVESTFTEDIVERDLTLLGLVGLIDPPRPEAREAVEKCVQAGIIPVMITGDHLSTATSIAKTVGIIRSKEDRAINATEWTGLSLEEKKNAVEKIRCYARVAPEQKIEIVELLQSLGHAVAMTGDGVNDAPALKRADIGIAMGINGTDVSKEASNMILLDDNFATIVNAIEEGRRVYDNIRKYVKYSMTGNSGQLWAMTLALSFGLPMPLLPIHILWINLVTDGLPGLAFTAEPAEKNTMTRPPLPPSESIFSRGLFQHLLWVGLLMGLVPFALQVWSLQVPNNHWQTMVFSVLCISKLLHAFAVRSDRQSLLSIGLFSNKAMFVAVLGTIVLQLLTIYLPLLQTVFQTHSLTGLELAIVFGASCVVVVVVEIEKYFKRRRYPSPM